MRWVPADLPVRIVATFTEDAENPEVAQAWRDLSGLLRENVYAPEGRAARITVSYLDVYQQRREAEQFGVEDLSGLTLRTRLNNVDWAYLLRSSLYIIPAALAGVFGLLNLPNRWLLISASRRMASGWAC